MDNITLGKIKPEGEFNMLNKKTVDDIDVKGKRVLVRLLQKSLIESVQ